MQVSVRYCLICLVCCALFSACSQNTSSADKTVTFNDQTGRAVEVPRPITRISGEGYIVYALQQQHKLVDRGMYGKEAESMARIDPEFAAKPIVLDVNKYNVETLTALKPQLVFANALFHKDNKDLMERAGLKVFATLGETLEESFQTVKLIADVLDCPDKAEAYLSDCRKLLGLVEKRIRDIKPGARLKVMFAGPKSVYSVASGQMLQTEIIERAGGRNVAHDLTGFWCDVSPEQVALWDPDVIFLGSSKNTYGADKVYASTQFDTVSAVQNKRVYAFPSNIGWWDWPAPHCVLGVLWAAKTMYPERFKDVDMLKIADDFYLKYRGHSFTELGGNL